FSINLNSSGILDHPLSRMMTTEDGGWEKGKKSLPVPSALAQPLVHMLRRRRHHVHRLLVPRNRNPDLAGMQMQDRFAESRAIAVDVVADDRPARRRRVHAQLMGAAGDRFQRQPTEAVAASADLPVCDGFLTVRVRLLPPAALLVE